MSDLSKPRLPDRADASNEILAALRHPEAGSIQRNVEQSDGRIFLPKRPGESRLAPPSYYYRASNSGVFPSWAVMRSDANRVPSGEAAGRTDADAASCS